MFLTAPILPPQMIAPSRKFDVYFKSFQKLSTCYRDPLRKVRTLSAGRFRPLVHDFQISGVAENPVALARGQFPYDA